MAFSLGDLGRARLARAKGHPSQENSCFVWFGRHILLVGFGSLQYARRRQRWCCESESLFRFALYSTVIAPALVYSFRSLQRAEQRGELIGTCSVRLPRAGQTRLWSDQ
jgi:hypothetical protein